MSEFKVGDILVFKNDDNYPLNDFWENKKLYKVVKVKSDMLYVERSDGKPHDNGYTSYRDSNYRIGFMHKSMVGDRMALVGNSLTNAIATELLDMAAEFTNLAKELL